MYNVSGVMSAAEIIDLIEKLPVTEQEQVRAYLDQKAKAASGDGVRRLDLKTATALGEDVFNQHPELFRKLAQ